MSRYCCPKLLSLWRKNHVFTLTDVVVNWEKLAVAGFRFLGWFWRVFHFVMHLFTRTHNTHWLCGWWRWLFHNQVAGFSSIPVKSFGSQWKSQSLLSAAVFNCQGSPVIEEGFRRSSSDVKMMPWVKKCCDELDFGLPAAWPWGGTTRSAMRVKGLKILTPWCLPCCLSSSVFNSQAYKDLGELAIEVKELLEDKLPNSQFKRVKEV